jgi:chorismate-pyruvate lyase
MINFPMNIHELFLKAWTVESFLRHCRKSHIDPLLRTILTSDGTITRTLQALHLNPFELEIKKQSEVQLDSEIAKFLEMNESEQAISRKIWLHESKRRMIYASTILAFSQSHSLLLEQIQETAKPLGLLLEEHQLPSIKDKLTIGRLVHPEIAAGLGLTPTTELWARHYRLMVHEFLRASVLEVFSPVAFETG